MGNEKMKDLKTQRGSRMENSWVKGWLKAIKKVTHWVKGWQMEKVRVIC